LCFVLGQLRLLRWCAHEAREETEEGHFESRAPTDWCFKLRQVCFMCALFTHFVVLISVSPGTHRRKHLYKMQRNAGRRLTLKQVRSLRTIGNTHWAQNNPASLESRRWEVDPVTTVAGRARRAWVVARVAPQTPEKEYRAFRSCTLELASQAFSAHARLNIGQFVKLAYYRKPHFLILRTY
jgi:hypothetical protein